MTNERRSDNMTWITTAELAQAFIDERTYDYTVALRAVTTDDFMTADWARIPYDVVRTISPAS